MARGEVTAAILAARGRLTIREIAAQVGTTYNTVTSMASLLRKQGREVHFRREGGPVRDKPLSDHIASLADGTMTIQEIADEVGISYNAVSMSLHRRRQVGEKVYVRYAERRPR